MKLNTKVVGIDTILQKNREGQKVYVDLEKV